MTLTLLLMLSLSNLHALPVCTANSQFREIPSIVSKVGVVGKAGRMLASQYAKFKKTTEAKVKKTYAPTGDVNCNGVFWGGQLTKKDDLITSAGHAFFNDDCSPKHPNLNECKFIVEINGKETPFDLESIEATGRKCDRVPFKGVDDWVIIKLKQHVPLKPYRVDQAETDRAFAEGKLVSVGKSSDFYQMKNGQYFLPKHYGDCEKRDNGTGSGRGMLVTDCDSAETSSGSSRLNRDMDDPVLVAIHSSGSETRSQLEQAWKNGRPNTKPYDRLDWSTEATPVSGELLQILNAY